MLVKGGPGTPYGSLMALNEGVDAVIEALVTQSDLSDRNAMRATRALVDQTCTNHSLGLDEAVNHIAIAVARRFLSNDIDYTDADWAMNVLWVAMLEWFSDRATKVTNPPDPAVAIYLAFDAGEWDRGDGADPVASYTVSGLTEILDSLG